MGGLGSAGDGGCSSCCIISYSPFAPRLLCHVLPVEHLSLQCRGWLVKLGYCGLVSGRLRDVEWGHYLLLTHPPCWDFDCDVLSNRNADVANPQQGAAAERCCGAGAPPGNYYTSRNTRLLPRGVGCNSRFCRCCRHQQGLGCWLKVQLAFY